MGYAFPTGSFEIETMVDQQVEHPWSCAKKQVPIGVNIGEVRSGTFGRDLSLGNTG